MNFDLYAAWEKRLRARRCVGLGRAPCNYELVTAGLPGTGLSEPSNAAWLKAVAKDWGVGTLTEWPGDGSCVVGGLMVFLP